MEERRMIERAAAGRFPGKLQRDCRRYADAADRFRREGGRYRAASHRFEREFPSPRPFSMGTSQAKRMRERIALAVLIAGAIALGAWGLGPLAPLIGGSARSGAVSTPVEEWRAGSVPMLYQTDDAWANDPYAGGTVAENGCGPTCMTMAYVFATGRRDWDPGTMSAYAEENGYVESGMTSWRFMTEGAAAFGLSSNELSADAGSVRDALGTGSVIVASVGPGDFTSTGHFIVIAGISDDGRLIVRDPNSAERTALAWDADRVLGQCLNLWALSA